MLILHSWGQVTEAAYKCTLQMYLCTVRWYFWHCCKPLINVQYINTFGAPDQGQTLDVRQSQTAESALRDDWTRNVPHHALEVVLEIILEHMCTGLRP
jgi:hypothetical protein